MTNQIFLFTLCLLPFIIFGELSCIGNSGAELTWWNALKYPEATGLKYAYLDSQSNHSEFEVIDSFVDSQGQALANTIGNINSQSGLSLLVFK